MDFGRLADISRVDFSLPPERAGTAAVLHTFGGGAPRFFVGAPIWGEKEWLGLIYPKNMRSPDALRHYARQFNSIELNTTYYRIPEPKTVAAWKAAAAPGFRFCPKIPQLISHEKQLIGCEDVTQVFCDVMSGLGEHLGPVFLQLNPGFGPESKKTLLDYLAAFPAHVRLFVEFRHEGWFRAGSPLEDVFRFMEERHFGTVITDTAGRRDALHMRLTSPAAFIRYTANDLHPTDLPRIDAWVERIAQWVEQGLQEVYFFIHTPKHVHVPVLSNYAVKRFNERLNARLSPCVLVDEQQPELF